MDHHVLPRISSSVSITPFSDVIVPTTEQLRNTFEHKIRNFAWWSIWLTWDIRTLIKDIITTYTWTYCRSEKIISLKHNSSFDKKSKSHNVSWSDSIDGIADSDFFFDGPCEKRFVNALYAIFCDKEYDPDIFPQKRLLSDPESKIESLVSVLDPVRYKDDDAFLLNMREFVQPKRREAIILTCEWAIATVVLDEK